MELNEILDRMRHVDNTCDGFAVAGIIGADNSGEMCFGNDCCVCREEAFRKLADEVEAAAFGGPPLDANGGRLMLGDKVCTDEFGEGTVVAASWKGKVCVRPSDAPSGKGGVWMRASETAHKPRPMSGDGVPLIDGRRVWLDGEEHVVDDVRPTRAKVAGRWRDASKLMAEPPEPEDTQERIDADALKETYVYWRCTAYRCSNCPSRIGGRKPKDHYSTDSCADAQTLDLLRRQRELDAEEAGR